jgi:thiol-disulfide isomerase/thioredoxin
MKRFLLFILVCVTTHAFSQQAEIVTVDKLKAIMDAKSDKIQIVNFWATWCGPCVKELPLFEKLTAEHHENINVTLVSMDLDLDPNPEKVYKFIARKNIKSSVVLLDAKDPNSYINKIEKAWSGALPATIIINQKTGQRKFIEKELHEGDLEKFLAEVK